MSGVILVLGLGLGLILVLTGHWFCLVVFIVMMFMSYVVVFVFCLYFLGSLSVITGGVDCGVVRVAVVIFVVV